MGEDRLLATYLNDHLAGSTVGLELARRAAGSNRDNEYGRVLERIAEEIEEDRATLEKLMTDLGFGKDRVKVTLAWTGEKLGRLKLNGSVLSYSPLSRLEELELLSLGVEGKLLAWKVLEETLGEKSPVDLGELIRRARSQRRRLETLRLKAAAEAL
jgi:hypothetical protein